MHLTLKTNPLRAAVLADFVDCYQPEDRSVRVETERFHRFACDELVAPFRAKLDITWLQDASLDNARSLPALGALAAEILEELEGERAPISELAASLPLDRPGDSA